MDFSALIADLRTIASRYNSKDTDRNVSTSMYCEMFRKVRKFDDKVRWGSRMTGVILVGYHVLCIAEDMMIVTGCT